jgi:hypothetical protein
VAVVVAAEFKRDTTTYSLFGPRCAYRLVIAKLLCTKGSAIVLERGTLHALPARKRVPQVAPTKVLDPRLKHPNLKLVSHVFERFAGLDRLEHTPSTIAPVAHHPKGGHRSIIQRGVYGFFVLRQRDVQHPTVKVYHVPRSGCTDCPCVTRCGSPDPARQGARSTSLR